VTAYAATLRLARIVTARTLELGSRDLGAAIVHRDGLTLERGAPVLVAHDDGRTVGRVSYLHEIRDDDGAPWIAAHVELDDPPSWLRVGTACSMAWTQPANPDGWIGRTEIVEAGALLEISLVPPSSEPKIRGACVVELERRTRQPSPTAADTADPLTPRRIVRNGIGEVLGIRC
jgi:hypothetical protein